LDDFPLQDLGTDEGIPVHLLLDPRDGPKEALLGLPACLVFFLIGSSGCRCALAKILLRPLSLMFSDSMIFLRGILVIHSSTAALLSAWQKTGSSKIENYSFKVQGK
jgi:hypothetical protein